MSDLIRISKTQKGKICIVDKHFFQYNLNNSTSVYNQGRTQDLKKGGAAREARKNLGSHPPQNCFAPPFLHPPKLGSSTAQFGGGGCE